MARKRMQGTVLDSWQQVDGALLQIGRLDREISALENRQNKMIDAVKEEHKERAKPLLEEKERLELALQQYCENNRGEFREAKTKCLTFGSVGFRISTKVIIKRIGETLQALKDYGLEKCIRVKEEPDKEAMRDLDTKTLAEVGASLKVDDVFGYEINREVINQEAGQAA